MQAKKEDDAEDDGGEKNLSDVIVEDLLVGVRGIVEVGFFLPGCFWADDGIDRDGCVLFYVHVL
jgi:hypothetical protein